MSAVNLTISIEQGATWQHTVTITDDGAPLNLTGYTARMEIRRNVGSTDAALLDLPGDDGTISMALTTGVITILIPAATTSGLTPPNPNILGFQQLGVFSLEITSGAGFVERVLEGQVMVSAEVTR